MKRLFYLMLVVLCTAAFTPYHDETERSNELSQQSNNSYEKIIIIQQGRGREQCLKILPYDSEEEIKVSYGYGYNNTAAPYNLYKAKGEKLHRVNYQFTDNFTYTIIITGRIRQLDCMWAGDIIEIRGNNSTLSKLQCGGGGSQLCSLNVSGFPNLIELDCSFGNLTSLDVSQNRKLKKLFCAGNGLYSLNINNCKQLITLNCCLNKLTSLNIRDCISLEYLDCCVNSIKSLDTRNNYALKTLYYTNLSEYAYFICAPYMNQ